MRRTIKLKRAYEAADPKDGCRVLVDRLWPRGMSKEAAHIDVWLKDIAPSTELRKWFNHEPARWSEFEQRYAREVERHPEALAQLEAQLRRGPVTLVYGARDEAHNNRSGSARLDSISHFLSGSLAVNAYAAFCIAGRLSK